MPTLFKLAPTIPKRLVDTDKIEAAVQRAMDQATKKAVAALRQATSSWDHKPTFTISATRWQRQIKTDDRVFNIVDQGAKPHQIPRRVTSKGFLQFQTAYRPKTIPGVLGSQGGGPAGPYIRKKFVNHPGIEGRDFSGTVTLMMQEELEAQVEEHIRAALGG